MPLRRVIIACCFRVAALSGHVALVLSPSGIAPDLNRIHLSAICRGGQSSKVIDLLARRCSPLGYPSAASGACTVVQISSAKRQRGERQASLKAALGWRNFIFSCPLDELLKKSKGLCCWAGSSFKITIMPMKLERIFSASFWHFIFFFFKWSKYQKYWCQIVCLKKQPRISFYKIWLHRATVDCHTWIIIFMIKDFLCRVELFSKSYCITYSILKLILQFPW